VLVWPAIALFGVLFLTNALVIDRFLAWSTFGDERFRPWVRFGRFALAGVPIVGLWTVALWRWIAARPPPWALREPVRSPDGEDAEPHGGLLAGPRALAFTWLGSGDHIAVLMLFNWLGMMFISLVSARALSSPWGWAGLVVWTAAFHGIGFGLMLYSLTEAARVGRLSGVRRWIYCGLAVLWLIPFPFLAIVGGLLVVLWDAFLPAFKRVETSVVYRAVEGGRGYSRLALRMGLERELRRCLAWLPWRHRLNYFVLDFERRQRPSRLENQILKLTRVKTFFLPFDSSCLAFLALKIADGSHHAGTISGILIRIGGLALVVGLTSFLIALLSQLIRRPRRPGARIVVVRPLQRLASTQLALAAGLWGGVGLAHGDPMRVASILAWGGGVLALAILYGHRLGLFNLPDSTEKDDNVSGVLALMFGVVWGIGFYLRLNPDIADAYLPVLLDAVCWLPLLGVALGWILLPWLLRPFRWTQIFAKKIPIPIRGLLILLAATAVLPLGGTAMPAWLVLRHRWWPRIELRELRARADSRSPSGSSSP